MLATGGCWISGYSEADVHIETFLLRQDKATGVKAQVERTLNIANHIADVCIQRRPDKVVIEAAAKNQKWQAAAIGELHGVVKAKLYERAHIVPMVEQATRLRSAVVGKISSKRSAVLDKDGKAVNRIDYGMIPGKRAGKTKKATIKDIIELRLKERGLTFPSQDEMDAYVAAKYAWDLPSIITVD